MKKIRLWTIIIFLALFSTSYASDGYKDIEEIRGDKNHYYDLVFDNNYFIIDDSQRAQYDKNYVIEDKSEDKKGNDDIDLLKEISTKTFLYTPGVGAFTAHINFTDENGSFIAQSSDQDMGTNTVTGAKARGRFSLGEKIDDYTYKLNIEDFERQTPNGGEEIIDGKNYVYTPYPHGFSNGDYDNPSLGSEFYLYLPFKNINDIEDKSTRMEISSMLRDSAGLVGSELRVFVIVNKETSIPYVETF